jgi:hypothetical protein
MKMKNFIKDQNGRPVEYDLGFDCDGAYFSAAGYLDGAEEDCSDETIDYLNAEYADFLAEALSEFRSSRWDD